MFGTKNVRVVNDMTWQKRLWFSLRFISFILSLVLFALFIFFILVCVVDYSNITIGSITDEFIKTYSLSNDAHSCVAATFFIGLFIPVSAFLTFLFHRLYILDAQLPPKLSNKLQERLKKYEYKHTKKTNNKQNRQANKSLKKDYKKQYKENKL